MLDNARSVEDIACVRRQIPGWWRVAAAGIGFLAVVGLCANGCGGDQAVEPGGGTGLKLAVALESPALATRIDRVTLSVCYDGRRVCADSNAAVVRTIPVEDGVINATLSLIPGDSVTITLRAFEDTLLLYSGSAGPLTIAPGVIEMVDITLVPALLMLRAAPLVQDVFLDADVLVDVGVEVYRVDSLFGAAFRLHYNPSILDFVGAVEDTFLRKNCPTRLFEVLKDTLGYVACATSCRRDPQGGVVPPGVSGSGRLLTLRFVPVMVGASEMVIDPATVHLENRYGEPVRNYQQLILESATVRVHPSNQ